MSDSVITACQSCGQVGSPVTPRTLEALCEPSILRGIEHFNGFRFCAEPACSTAYYRRDSSATISKGGVLIPIGCKDGTHPRTVCYCFDHTVEEIAAQIAASGACNIADGITQSCREGLQSCETTNPKGRCCLGDVRREIQLELDKHTETPPAGDDQALAPPPSDPHDCCATPESAPGPQRPSRPAGGLAAVGALLLAGASSACCWLPLALLAVGVSGAGAAAALDTYRIPLLVGTAALLLIAFVLVYRRPTTCDTGGSCPPPSRWARLNKPALWVTTLVVAAFAAFPEAVQTWMRPEDDPPGLRALPGVTEFRLGVLGMTCEACTVPLEALIEDLPSVEAASVSYTESEVRVWIQPDDAASARQQVRNAIDDAGYESESLDP